MQIQRKNSSSLIDKLVKWTGFVLLLTSIFLPTAQTTPICYGKVDFIVAIDASYSILDQNFKIVCNFVADLYTKILFDLDSGQDLGVSNLRTGVIIYAEEVYGPPYYVTLSGDQSGIVSMLANVERDNGNIKTNTGAALEVILDIYLKESNQDTYKIMVLITDGKADNQTRAYAAASLLKSQENEKKVHIIVIGIGVAGENIDQTELNTIASSNMSVHIFTKITNDLMMAVQKDFCMQTLGSKTGPPVAKDAVVMDIYFLVDATMSDVDYDISKQFIKDIMETFVIGEGNARVSLIQYGESVLSKYLFSVGTYATEAATFSAIDALTRSKLNDGARNVAPVLQKVTNMIAASTAADPVIVVLFVTGSADDAEAAIKIAEEFRLAADPNVYLIVFGIGTNTLEWDSERNRLAYDLGTAFRADNFLFLSETGQESIDFRGSMRKVVYEFAVGTYVSIGTVIWRDGSMVDGVFMIDGSMEMSRPIHYAITKYVVKELIDGFRLGPEEARIAVMLFDAAGVYASIKFDTYNHDHDELFTLIDKLPLILRQETVDNTIGLAKMRQYFLDNSRESAAKLGYLITMGQANNPVSSVAVARALAFEGIQLLEIGIGSGVSASQLNSYQMFEPIDGPVLITPINTFASSENLDELTTDIRRYAEISRPRGRYFRWDAQFDFIVMLHDESSRVNGGESVKYFLLDVFQRYEIGIDKMMAGLITFGAAVNTGTSREIILGSNSFHSTLNADIMRLQLMPTGGPNVAAALDNLIVMFNTYGRPGVSKVALLLLQGDVVLDDLTTQIATIRAAGIAVTAIGIGAETDLVDLTQISYNSEEELAFLQTNWQTMDFTPANDAAVISLARGDFEAQGVGSILRLPSQCSGNAGIMFVLDASVSTVDIFDDVKDFTAAQMSGFMMPDVGMGALAFANQVLGVIIPGQYQSYVELYAHFMVTIDAIDNYLLTNTDLAITRVKDIFDAAGYDEMVAVLIYDGKSYRTNETVQRALEARAAGIHIIAIGIGSDIYEDELKEVTGNEMTGNDNHVFLFNNNLTNVMELQSVQALICKLIRPGDCLAGSYRDPISMVCNVCEVGTYQSLSEELFCASCGPGETTATTGATSDSACIMKCNAGYYDNGGAACQICPIGEYQPASDQTTCIACDSNFPITKYEGSTSVDDCISDKCDIAMDLVFVVDSTASIGTMEFNLLKAFLVNQLEWFQMGPAMTHTKIAIVRIGTLTTDADVYGFFTDKSDATDAIRALQGGDLSTNTASALQMASSKLEQNGRTNIPNVIFIVTDGISHSPYETRYQAILAQQKSQIAVLGVGSQYFFPELRSLTSEDILINENYFLLPAFDAYTTICKAAHDWTAPVAVVNVNCDLRLDIIFIMDMSESLDNLQRIMMKARLVGFVNSLDISATKVQIGVLSFGSTLNTGLPLSADKALIIRTIRSQPSAGFGTVTDEALKEAEAMLDGSIAAKAILIITDGNSNNYTKTALAAQQVEDKGIYVVAVGVGTSDEIFERELNAISTTGPDSTILVNSLVSLTTAMLQSHVCPENFECSYNLHVTYIWYLSNDNSIKLMTQTFSTDVSERFHLLKASVMEVSSGTDIDTLLKAVTEVEDQMNAEQVTDITRNIVIITDLSVTNFVGDAGSLLSKTNALKEAGVKILIVNAGDDLATEWEAYATSSATVFTEKNFTDKEHAWNIQWSLCKEPCDSGFDVGADGKCKECAKDTYRDKDSSYACQSCPDDSLTDAKGKTSENDCVLDSRCDVPMDLVFVIDATASIGARDYALLKSFFWNLVDKFYVGLADNETRIAVAKIGEFITEADYTLLSASIDDITVKNSIRAIQGNEPETNTAATLEKVIEIFETGRDQAVYPYIVVVATDGKSVNTFQTKRSSSRLKLKGIRTEVIALGNSVFPEEIQALAYDADSIHAFQSYLSLFQSNLHEHICDAARNYVPPDSDPSLPVLIGKCKSYMDMVFVIDASMSVTQLTFLKMRIFISQFAHMLDIGQDKIRIGIMAFSNNVDTNKMFTLEQSTDHSAIEVMGVQPQSWNSTGSTNTADALAAMVDMFTDQGRPNTPFVGIVMTDGISDDPTDTKLQAQNAKDKGIHLVAIGFGQNVYAKELYDMATDPASVKIVNTFDELTTAELLDLSCSDDFICLYEMDIIALWDVEDFDTITRAEIFLEDLKESFSHSKIENVFVDDVDNVAIAMNEGVQKHIDTLRTDSAVSRVIIVITDKDLTTVKGNLQVAASEAKDNGILVVVVDAAATSNSIEDIASNNKLSYTTDKFNILPYNLVLKRSLCTEPCPSGEAMSADGSCVACPENKYREMSETFLCTDCPIGRSTLGLAGAKQLTDCLYGICIEPMDVVFVIDSSGSIRSHEFTLMKVFLLNTIYKMDISSDLTRVGLVPYTSDILLSQVFPLELSTNQEAVQLAVRDLRQGKLLTGTNTAGAIDTAKYMIIHEGRQNVMHTIVVITDGISTNTYRTVEESKKAQEEFIRVYSVGVGHVYADELYKIASDIDSVKFVDDFIKLAQITDFTETICEHSFTCTKAMDIVIFEDDTTSSASDADFKSRVSNFATFMDTSYSATVIVSKYTSMAVLEMLLKDQDLSGNTQNTKMFIFISKTDIDDDDVKANIHSKLLAEGGMVSVINANNDLGNTNFVTMVSGQHLLFPVEGFDELPAYRFIERKLCTEPCSDGEQRTVEGICEKCPIGQYRERTNTHKCMPCAADKTTADIGATLPAECIANCGPGFKKDGDTCILCDKGTYQADSFQNDCDVCPSGYTTEQAGSTFADQCVRNCVAGEKRTSDNQNCEICPENTYQPDEAQSECLTCPINLITYSAGITSQDECIDACGVPMDIVFLVDASVSLSIIDFTLVKIFVENSILKFKVGPNDTRIGILQFADTIPTSPRLNLVDSVDRNSAVVAAKSLTRATVPGTDTAGAINAAVEMFKLYGRAFVHKNIIVVTDGKSDGTVGIAVEAAKKEFIHMISIGVDNFNLEELQKIATDDSSVKTFKSFYELYSIDILPAVCTPTHFSCDKQMDIFYITHFANTSIEQNVNTFFERMNETHGSSNFHTEIDDNTGFFSDDMSLLFTMLNGNPDSTKIVIIFTDSTNNEGNPADNIAVALKEKGVVIAVVYVSDDQTDTTYNNIVSKQDLLFFSLNFHGRWNSDFIVRSLCIAACVDGTERDLFADCAQCEKGTYRTAANDHVCVDCPLTQTTSGTGAVLLSECVTCSPTEWQCVTGNECIPETQQCDNTTQCTDHSDEICNFCSQGMKWVNAQCVPCELGTYQPNPKQTECIACPDGSTTGGLGQDSVDDCNVLCDNSGQMINYPYGECVDCIVGYYRDKVKEDICLPCPDQFTTLQSASVTQADCVPECQIGQFQDDSPGVETCKDCRIGTYQSSPNQYTCIACPTEGTTTASVKSTSEEDCKDPCPEGEELPSGGTSVSDCVTCPVGTYKSSTSTICLPCPSQYTTAASGSTTFTDCILDCGIGYYQDETVGKCQECKFGEYQDLTHQTTCKVCEVGKTTLLQGSTAESDCYVPCPAGSNLPYQLDGTCTPCPQGWYREDDQNVATCLKCNSGKTTLSVGSTNIGDCIEDCLAGSRIDGNDCIPCEVGQYQSLPGQYVCVSCDVFTSTVTSGADEADLCEDLCPSGSELTQQNPVVCVTCDMNFYKETGVDVRCTECPANHITLSVGGSSKQECLHNCSSGQWSDEATGQCVSCEKGTFQTLWYQDSCVNCRDGWTTIGVGAEDESECVSSCKAGEHLDASICVECDPTEYQPDPHQLVCIKCPDGMLTDNPAGTESDCEDKCGVGSELAPGGTSAADCVNCDKGTYKDGTTATCQPCEPEGYTTSGSGSVASSECIFPCLEGHYSDAGLAISACVECETGTYQNEQNQLECKPCEPDGYTTLQTGSTQVSQCVSPCFGGGSAWNVPTKQCEPCRKGEFQNEENKDTCKQCGSGKTTPGEGSDSESDCYVPTDCAVNQWRCDNGECISENMRCDGFVEECTDKSDESSDNCCLTGHFYNDATSQCTVCPVGTYQDAAGKTACIACAKGLYTATDGSSSKGDCTECDAGYQFVSGSVECTKCPVNTYRELDMMQCDKCPFDFVTLSDASVAITDCKAPCEGGEYYNINTFSCESCPLGWFQESEKQTECVKCPTGTTNTVVGSSDGDDCADICDDGTTLVYDATGASTQSCDPCPIGSYKNSAYSTCQLCPTGFTTAGAGSTECLPHCGPGHYYLSKASSICAECGIGTHQPGSLQDSCIDCPTGTTTIDTGATTLLLCYDICPNGYEYDSATCIVCPIGTYREHDVDRQCTACSSGYTTERAGTATADLCVPDCVAGQFYSRDNGQCEPCFADTYQTEPHQFVCIVCPPGTIVAATGSDDISDCLDPCKDLVGQELQPDGSCAKCTIGYVKVPPSTVCVKCSVGFTTPALGGTKCVPDCDAGFYHDGTKCSMCRKGTYQSASGQYSCEACPLGSTTAGPGADTIGLCIDVCPSGFQLLYIGTCIACEKNYYRTQGEQLQCTSCPGDFITLFEGSISIADCVSKCQIGTYAATGGTGDCKECPVGTYQDQVYQKECIPCDAGKTTIDTGATSVHKCVGDCGPGTFLNASGKCEDCAKGTYQSESYREECAPCTAGYTTDITASTTIADCYDKCESGYTYDAVNNKCEECGVDKYRDKTLHNLCQDCPPPLITQTTRATSKAECKSRCPSGEYWHPDKAVCIECAVGTYQPDPFTFTCIPCDDGWITLTTGAKSQAECFLPCLEGEELNALGDACVPCPIGKYQDTKYEESCKECATGESTQSTHSTDVSDCESTPCISGQWRCLNGGECVASEDRCNGVYECTDNSDEDGCDCTAGEFYNVNRPGIPKCENCPVGSYQGLTGQLFCIDCPVGYTTAADRQTNRDQCTEICVDGSRFDPANPSASSDGCVICPAGTYRKSGQDNPETCINCPSPFTTESAGAAVIALCVSHCFLGQYYDVIPGTGCVDCSVGYYQDQRYDQYSCIKCQPGTTTQSIGSDSESDCTDVCPLGEELPISGTTQADCTPCEKGFYKDFTTYVCTQCGIGLTTLHTGSESSGECIPPCTSGQEFNGDKDGCKSCDNGFFKVNPPTNANPACDPCPAGMSTKLPGADRETLCEDLCNDGLELSADRASCIACGFGKYRTRGVGDAVCNSCPPGTSTKTIGSASASACLRNCAAGQKHDTSTGDCVPCDIDTYQDLPFQEICKDCPTWKTTVGTGSDDYLDCIDSCENGWQTVDARCVQCERGSYREKDVQESCETCRDKFTTLAEGSATVDQCVPNCGSALHWDENSDSCVTCEDGTHNPFAYQLQCIDCPPDKPVSADNFLTCEGICPAGESWNAAKQVCNWCAAGTYSVGGDKSCVRCPTGTYSFMIGAVSVNDCVLCPGGKQLVGSNCLDCAAGSYRPDGDTGICKLCDNTRYQELTGQTFCTSCPSGETTSGVGSSTDDCRTDWCTDGYEPHPYIEDTCVPCQVGSYKLGNTGSCLLCEVNTYQHVTGQTYCIPCPDGETTYGEGADNIADCQTDWCPGGQQVKSEKTDECEDCALGTYKPDGDTGYCKPCDKVSYQDETGQTTCKPCTPDDYYTMNYGSTSLSDCSADWCSGGQQVKSEKTDECEDCALGTYKPDGDTGYCKPCDKVSYQDETGQTTCKPCTPDDYYTMNYGSTSLSDCSADWCPAGQVGCDDCGFGMYRSTTDVRCQTCPSGITYTLTAERLEDCQASACAAGSFINVASNSCDLCPLHTYSDQENQYSCTPCPVGFHTAVDGASGIDKCAENWCDGGYIFDDATQECVPCGYGKYRQFKVDKVCISCPGGQTTATNTASESSDCVDSVGFCRNGYESRVGRCKPCPIGYYKTENTNRTCVGCPYAFTTRRTGADHENLCISMSSRCESQFDLVIVVDVSNSVLHDASHHINLHLKPWLKCFVGRLNIHPDRVRISIVTYASRASELIDLWNGCFSKKISRSIEVRLKPSRSFRVNTAAAIRKAFDLIGRQGRQGVQKHVLLIMDERSDNTAIAVHAANLLKDRQVHFTVIGADGHEVPQLASSPYSEFYISSYTHLPPDYDVVRAICRPR